MDLAINEYFATVGFVKSIRDAHRRGFSRAVLADNGMNRSRLHDNIDVVVSEYFTKPFRNISEFKHCRSLALGLGSWVFDFRIALVGFGERASSLLQ